MEELIARYSKIPERVRWAAGGGILVALVAAFFFLVHTGQQSELASLEEQYRKLEVSRQEKRAYADNLPKYEARFSELQQSLNTARAMLPDTADVPQFLAQLGNSGRDVGLTIDRFEPKDERPQDFYAEIAFGVQVHGSYHEIASFIDQVGKVDRIVNVSDIAMTLPKYENQKTTLSGAFNVKTYRFLTAEQLAEIEAKKGKK